MKHALLALSLTSPALAQGDWRMVMDQCLTSGPPGGCTGLAARLCEAADGPMARGLCLGAETAYWQDRAARALAELAAREGDVQALAAHQGVPAPSLSAIEGGFAAYLDATCAWAEGQWDGVHAGWEWADCRLRLTAGHAQALQGLVEALP